MFVSIIIYIIGADFESSSNPDSQISIDDDEEEGGGEVDEDDVYAFKSTLPAKTNINNLDSLKRKSVSSLSVHEAEKKGSKVARRDVNAKQSSMVKSFDVDSDESDGVGQGEGEGDDEVTDSRCLRCYGHHNVTITIFFHILEMST